jgi:hypothetical protein
MSYWIKKYMIKDIATHGQSEPADCEQDHPGPQVIRFSPPQP